MQFVPMNSDRDGEWPPFPFGMETPCMHCDMADGHWERVWTGDVDSRDGFEDWYCCHACRDAGLPCDTFHRIEPLNTA